MTKIEYEIDNSVTVGGLPAPHGWHIVQSRLDQGGYMHAHGRSSLVILCA